LFAKITGKPIMAKKNPVMEKLIFPDLFGFRPSFWFYMEYSG